MSRPTSVGAIALVALAMLCVACVADYTTLWPLPTSVLSNSATSSIGSSFTIASTQATGCQSSDLLNAAIARYLPLMFWNGNPTGSSSITNLMICVTSADQTLQFGIDETYQLYVPTSGKALLNSTTVYGALRGLETFAQLVEWQPASRQGVALRGETALQPAAAAGYVVAGLPIQISDKPRYAWRGLMLDTARHFLPVSTLLKQIDIMSYNKFNTLHWHLVDAQSFPFEVAAYPNLSGAGAYDPSATFSPQDVATVVAYAQQRGIRVVAEFDVPGHAAAWGQGYPITANCPKYNHNINNIPLTPVSAQTLPIFTAVVKQAASQFPDETMHVGGDEVVQSCWSNDPAVVAWMQARGMSTNDLYQWFVTQIQQTLLAQGRTPMHWQEVVDNGLKLDPSTIVEIWEDRNALVESVQAGYRTVLAAGNYLDKQIPNPNQTFYEFEDTWKNFYSQDPIAGLGLTPAQQALVIGGEAAMWGEQVDSNNIVQRIWPRACAVAERYWSLMSVTDLTAAQPRLAAHACRMQRRGVGNGPLAPGFCLQKH